MSQQPSPSSPRWTAFLLVSTAYLATTTGEALLSPIYPVVAGELGMDLGGAGAAFAVLAGTIAAANLVSGLLLRWLAANRVVALALLATAGGGAVAASAGGEPVFLAGQALLGTGAGLLYPAAIMSVGTFAGPSRRGLAMGLFGVFFSAGLILAAGMAALGSTTDWRLMFVAGSVLAVVAAVGVWPIADAPRSTSSSLVAGLPEVLGTPSIIGVVGAISQYATVSFLPAFAVGVWDLPEAGAALVLAAGRVLSVPSKLVSGAVADRIGPTQTARATGAGLAVTGGLWALAPWLPLAVVGAVAFTAGVSGLFPLANTVAFERVGRSGTALGAFRSLQLGAGAGAGYLIGLTADEVGLRPVVAAVSLLPVVLVALRETGATHSGMTAPTVRGSTAAAR